MPLSFSSNSPTNIRHPFPVSPDTVTWIALTAFIAYTAHITIRDLSSNSSPHSYRQKGRRPIHQRSLHGVRRIGASSFVETGLQGSDGDTGRDGDGEHEAARPWWSSWPSWRGSGNGRTTGGDMVEEDDREEDAVDEDGVQVNEERGPKRPGPEDGIPLPILSTLATSPPYDIRQAAIKILVHRFASHPTLLPSLIKNHLDPSSNESANPSKRVSARYSEVISPSIRPMQSSEEEYSDLLGLLDYFKADIERDLGAREGRLVSLAVGGLRGLELRDPGEDEDGDGDVVMMM